MEVLRVNGSVFHEGAYSISTIMDIANEERLDKWLLTNVNGSNDVEGQVDFLYEMKEIITKWVGPWVLMGDFNITRFQKRRSGKGNCKKMSRLFHKFIDDLQLIEVKLQERCYIWSNHREELTMKNLD